MVTFNYSNVNEVSKADIVIIGVPDESKSHSKRILLPIAYSALKKPKHFRWFFAAYVLGAVLSGFYGVAVGNFDAEGRLQGVGGGPNAIAMLGVSGFFLSAGLCAGVKGSPALRAAALAGMGLCFLELMLTLSRGGFVGFAVAMVASLFVVSRGRGKLVASALLLVVGVVSYFSFLGSPESRERLSETGSGSGRIDIWTVGWRVVEENPVQGVGVGNFIPTVPDYVIRPGAIDSSELFQPVTGEAKYAHNSYLQVWAETGAVGLALFLAIISICVAATVNAAREFNRRGNDRMEGMARGLFAAQAGLLAMAFFESIHLSHQLWLVLALGPAMLGLARHADASQGR